MNIEKIERILTEYPICQYGILHTKELIFSEKVRHICKADCSCYGTTWACPPGVGTVEECRLRCLEYKHVLIFTTLAEVADTGILEETLKTREGHEEVTKSLLKDIRKQVDGRAMALSSESCSLCKTCTYPKAPCRCPQDMLPCVESYGILVTESAAKCDIDFFYDHHTVTWFGMIFFKEKLDTSTCE